MKQPAMFVQFQVMEWQNESSAIFALDVDGYLWKMDIVIEGNNVRDPDTRWVKMDDMTRSATSGNLKKGF